MDEIMLERDKKAVEQERKERAELKKKVEQQKVARDVML